MTEPPRFEIIPDGHEHCWTVTGRGGSPIICEDPILWPDLQEIECYD